ncbi:MAG TPA: DinB family protein [Chloroflexota bacterium]|nr:DinB family protein [Chloroflexota bacterium]
MDPTQVVRDDDGVMRCRDCGFRYELDPAAIGQQTATGLEAAVAALAGVPDSIRALRPAPRVWSVNAYASHLADAAGVIHQRVVAIAEQERPYLPYHDQDEAVATGDADLAPASESTERLRRNVEAFQTYTAAIPPSAWDRVGVHQRAGEVRLRDIAQDMPHELHHHARDIRTVGDQIQQIA